MTVLDIMIRTLVSFFVLLFLTRMMGKKQMSQLTFFNYVTGITIGSVTGMLTLDRRIPYMDGLVAVVGWSLLTIMAAWFSLKSPRARIWIDGEPTILIKEGQVLEKALAGLRLNMDDLSMLLRNKNIFSLDEVETAVLEPNGHLSVTKKPEKRSPTKGDLGLLTVKPLYMPTELVSDGQIIFRNLRELNLTPEWLENQLRLAGTALKKVFYVEIKEDGTLYIDKKRTKPPRT